MKKTKKDHIRHICYQILNNEERGYEVYPLPKRFKVEFPQFSDSVKLDPCGSYCVGNYKGVKGLSDFFKDCIEYQNWKKEKPIRRSIADIYRIYYMLWPKEAVAIYMDNYNSRNNGDKVLDRILDDLGFKAIQPR